MKRLLFTLIAVALTLIAILVGTIPASAKAIECPTANMRVALVKDAYTHNKAKCWYSNGIGNAFPVADFCIGNAPQGTTTFKATVTAIGYVKCVWKVCAGTIIPGWRRL